MKKLFTSLLLILTLNITAQDNLNWHTDVNKAIELSVKTNKPLFFFFTGSDWCGWCKKLKKAVFDTKLFKDWAKKNVILFELDYPRRTPQNPEIQKQNRELQQTFRQFVRGYPTVILFEIERTYKDDGSKDKDNIQLLPSTQLVLQGQGRMGYMSNPESFIEKAELIIDVKKD